MLKHQFPAIQPSQNCLQTSRFRCMSWYRAPLLGWSHLRLNTSYQRNSPNTDMFKNTGGKGNSSSQPNWIDAVRFLGYMWFFWKKTCDSKHTKPSSSFVRSGIKTWETCCSRIQKSRFESSWHLFEENKANTLFIHLVGNAPTASAIPTFEH